MYLRGKIQDDRQLYRTYHNNCFSKCRLNANFYDQDDKRNESMLWSGLTSFATLVPRATLCGVAELHVASGMPQWRMFVTACSCYI